MSFHKKQILFSLQSPHLYLFSSMKLKLLKITFILLGFFIAKTSCAQNSLTNGQIYNFNVGDIMQGRHFMRYEGKLSGFNGPPAYETHTILQKQQSKLADTLFYKIKREYYTPKTCDTCFTSLLNDTIVQLYTNLNLIADHYNTTDKLDINDTLYFNTCNRKIWEKSPIIDSSKIAGAMIHKTYFIEGLGGPYFTKVEPQGPVYSEFVLTYFKKPNLTCGTFVTANVNQFTKFNVSIFPNPTKGNFTIKTEHPFKNATIKLFNINGQLVHKTENIKSLSIEFQRDSQPSGIYFLQIIDQLNVFNTKLIFN